MTEETDLKVGSFYWVLIVLDPDSRYVVDKPDGDLDIGWENENMPARFAGRDPEGKLLWNYMGMNGESNWPVRWIGNEILPPSRS